MPFCIEKNYHVTVVDNLSRGRLENISQLLELPRFVNEDLLDYSNPNSQKTSALQRIVDKSDIIFHLAANPDIAIGTEDTHIDFQQNVQATYNLLESVRRSQLADDYEKTRRIHKAGERSRSRR